MDIQSVPYDDVSSLAWVQDELRKSLDAAHKALRRTLKENEAAAGSDLDDVEPTLLRTARGHLHQSVGVLELVGLPAGAALLRGSEAAVQRFIAKPQTLTTAAVEAIERSAFALHDFLARRLAGKALSPVALFPQYRAVHELAGTPHIHPADLWPAESPREPLPVEPHAAPRGADAALTAEFESQVLASMRPGGAAALQRLSDLSAGLAAGAAQTGAAAEPLATLWQLAAGFFQAHALGLLEGDLYAKRIPSRLLAQLRQQVKGQTPTAERLARELLFLCAQAQPAEPGQAPRLEAVKSTYPAARQGPLNYQDIQLGRFDPAWITQARKRVANAKDTWSAVAGGEMHRLGGLNEQFALVADSLKRLLPGGESLGEALARTVADTVQSAASPEPAMAMEVATSLLYVEAALEDGAFDQPEQTPRVQHLAQRLDAVRGGAAPQPLEAWMEELYRRVSDRQTMGSVVQELRSALSESEKLIDQFFRAPAEPGVLIPVPAQLQAMRGVFSVLGLDKATQAVLRMRDDVDALVAAGPQARHEQPLFERLAGNLSALSFLIDLLGVQPQVVKSLFRFDPDTGLLSSRMGRHSTPLEVAAASYQEPAVVVEAAPTGRGDAARPLEALSPVPLATAPAVPAVTGLEADDEMREVFLEEAREVVGTARGALADLQNENAAIDLLTTVRRSFHTFKGSARMVGLNEFGEAAWACEQLYNDVLARQQPASEDFVRVSGELLNHLAAWIEAVARGQDASWRSRPVREVADALRLEGRASTIATPALADELPPPPLASMPAALLLPAASDLDLAPPAEPVGAVEDLPAPAGLDFVFDLGDAPAEDGPPPLLADSEPVAAEPPPLPEPDVVKAPLEAEEAPPHGFEGELAPIGIAEDLHEDATADIPEAALPVASLIEPLSPSAEVDVLRAAAEESPATGEGALADAPESATVPFEPNELVVALHPSSPGALAPSQQDEPATDGVADDEAVPSDQIKVIGSLQIGIPLFNIFLTEADELSRRLAIELSEWSHELDRPVGETAVSLAHSLGGSSATVGFIELSALARRLEQALSHSQHLGHGTAEDAALFVAASDEVRRLLHQFAAGFLKQAAPGLLERLSAHELEIDERLATQQAAAALAETPSLPSLDDVAATDFIGTPGYADTAVFPAPNTDYADLGVAEFKPYVEPISLSEPGTRPVSALAFDSDEDIDSVDAVDPELFPIFEEEALELLPELASHLRDWSRQPSQTMHASASMRTLHTLKGGARLAGAMRLGEMAHRLETAIEHLLPQDDDTVIDGAGIEQLLGRADGLSNTFEALRRSDAQAYGERTSGFNHLGAPLDAPAEPPVLAPLPALSAVVPTVTDEVLPEETLPVTPPASLAAEAALAAPEPPAPSAPAPAERLPAFDWTRFVADEAARPPVAPAERAPLQTAAAVRVRTQLLDRMVNQAGEVSIARARLESEVGQIKGSLGDLTDNLERLRGQLRDIELQAETQMVTRMEAAKAAAQAFDPLEFDRFTRFQELTRMMAESVNDVATVQRTLQRTLQTAEDELAAQARLTRDLQDDLLRTRMVEFEGLSERLYRVVRQAAKETGKQVRLDIVGGSIEVDRGVLDRMTGAFEHLLRNCITHGIEPAAERVAAGKDATGSIVVALHQEGNEVSVEFRDDGMGLDLARIREKGAATGLIAADANPSDADLANLIFMPGFSTADKVTELAGRGVGMDVVRSEVNALGGRIETASAPGQGTSFKLVLPLTTAVTQVVMLRCGDVSVAVPATLIEVVRRASAADVEQGYQTGAYAYGEQTLAMLWLGALLQVSGRSTEPTTRTTPVLIVRSAQQRIALHVDEVLGNQEVVVKNLGPQLSSLPGLAGMTLLASGAVTLIYNPVALATVYGDAARRAMALARSGAPVPASAASLLPAVPLVLVVDDSLTVRRVTQRLLVREGYRVVLAKDGFEALERLKEERPSVVLSDIEMPRMDGFDLLRNIRSEAGLAALPVIMITSRIAQKHRDYAHQLGVNHYLGKPYSEEELLSLIGRYCAQPDVVI